MHGSGWQSVGLLMQWCMALAMHLPIFITQVAGSVLYMMAVCAAA